MKYQVSHTTATISLSEYIRDYRDSDKFILFCQQCNRYNACWACPPFDFDTSVSMSGYEDAYIIGSKITLDANLVNECTGLQSCKDTAYQIIKEVRRTLDKRLLELEYEYPNSRALFAGTCHICAEEKCTRINGQPCLFPDKIRPSLESFGFDIGKTSAELLDIELKWSSGEKLPEYFVLVSGLFTTNKTGKIVW